MRSLSDPMAILYERIEGTAAWRERGRTEMMLNNEGGGGAHAGGRCTLLLSNATNAHRGHPLRLSSGQTEVMLDNGGMAWPHRAERTLLKMTGASERSGTMCGTESQTCMHSPCSDAKGEEER